ncbi:MAG: phospho-N-acetylmuramoyl-pentapeptide-transferase [Mycoplasmatales bacterium]
MSVFFEIFLLIVLYIISYLFIGNFIKRVTTKYVQPLLKDGPEHTQKVGTPTMGGVSFILLFITLIIFFAIVSYQNHSFYNNYIFLVILITLIGYFLIGFKDDYDKVRAKQNDFGLSPKAKLVLQSLVSILIISVLIINKHDTNLFVPLINLNLNLHIFYYLIVIFLLLATTNATNLTDGVDGLLTSNSIITLIFLTIISFLQSNTILLILNIIFIIILLAFLKYNLNPAKIFMGDVGSLAIGGYLSIVAILLKIEILFIFFSFIYFVETLSVIMQVSYFKYTKKRYHKGQRLLLMAPLHHHYEKKGLSENKIVLLFSLINIVASIIGMLIYYLTY